MRALVRQALTPNAWRVLLQLWVVLLPLVLLLHCGNDGERARR